MTAAPGIDALSEKEKEALRLLLAGHDAKSSAARLGVSHHAIHDRLRGARRKTGATSSREAALLLAEAEGGNPQSMMHEPLGDAIAEPGGDPGAGADRKDGDDPRPDRRRKGLIVMTIIITIAAAAAFGLAGGTGRSTGEGSAHPVTQVVPAEARSEAEARAFMQLLDAGKTRESYAATTAPFRETTKFKMWELGVMLNRLKGGAQRRTLTGAERDDAPVSSPYPSVEILTFETVMLNGERRSERIVMGRENGRWRVAKVDITYSDEE